MSPEIGKHDSLPRGLGGDGLGLGFGLGLSSGGDERLGTSRANQGEPALSRFLI